MKNAKIISAFLLAFLVHFSSGLLLPSHAAGGTALGNLATQMQPGTWAILPTNNLTSTVAQTGGSSNIAYTFMPQHGIWFPSVKKAMFTGGDHNGGNERLMIYDDSTNTWSNGPTPPGGWQQNHGHGYNAGDTIQNKLYYHLTGSVYNINSGSWSGPGSLPNSISGLSRANNAFAYLPGHGNFEFGAGGIWRLPDGGAWQELAPFRTYDFGGVGELSPFAIYNHILDAIWFGGGDGTNNTFLLKWDGSQYVVTQLPDPPVDQISGNNGGVGSGTRSQLDYDPATGDLLLFDKTFSVMGFYAFNVNTNTWSSLPTPPFSTADVDKIVTFPVINYGVNVAIEYLQSTQTATMHVYKHGQGSSQSVPPDTTAPTTPVNLATTSLSSSEIALSWSTSTDNVGVTGYNIFRNGTLISSPTGTSFLDSGLVPSTTYSYTIQAKDAAGNVSPKTTGVDGTTQSSSSAQSTPPPPPSGSMTFEQVCALGTTINCWGFESPDNIFYARGHLSPSACDSEPFIVNHINGNNDFGFSRQSWGNTTVVEAPAGQCNYPQIDSTFKTSGNSSLKFTIPSGSGQGTSGDFIAPFKRIGNPPNSTFGMFGPGSDFWVRWSERDNEALITNKYQRKSGGAQGGVKRVIIHGVRSSGGNETTIQDTDQREIIQAYGDQGSDIHDEAQGNIGCFANTNNHSNINSPLNYPEPPCRKWKANEWVTYHVHIIIPNPVSLPGTVEFYINDETTPIIRATNVTMNTVSSPPGWTMNNTWDPAGNNEGGYGQFSFTLFATDKLPGESHPEGAMWIDDVVVSHTRVPPIAGTGSSSGDTTPPGSPTGLIVQ